MAHFFDIQLTERSNASCELCKSISELNVFEVPPVSEPTTDHCVMACENCRSQITGESEIDETHWRCLQESAWSQIPSIQVVSWRMLKRLNSNGWAQDLFDQLYLDESQLEWAEDDPFNDEPTLDSNGSRLFDGDTVQIIKDLDVKGTGFVAKRGTIVKNIRLTSNTGQVEGRVNKTAIVLKTEFLKKTT
ncbi:MAG: protein PhnA [Mariniblastus sp.]|jgi:protein PhnA